MKHIRIYAMTMLLVMLTALTACGGGSGGGGGEESAKDDQQSGSDQIETLTRAQAQNALYAAYAGIGYNSSTAATDDEPLYNVMVNDLNLMASEIAMQIISTEENVDAFLAILMTGGSQTFTYEATGVNATLTLNYNILTGLFNADLSVDLDAGGYTVNNVVYRGNASGVELTVALDGIIPLGLDLTPSIQEVNVAITTDENLTADYQNFSVHYREWNITFAIDEDLENYNISPALVSMIASAPTTDERLYTLRGEFDIIDGTTRSYTYDMTYGQADLSSGMYVAMEGTLSLPGFEGKVVNVSSSGLGILSGNDSINTANSICRTDAGVWTSGTATINAAEDSFTAAFSADGSVTLSPGDTEVQDWQTSLAPF
jgi:hypothetical protein